MVWITKHESLFSASSEVKTQDPRFLHGDKYYNASNLKFFNEKNNFISHTTTIPKFSDSNVNC